MIDYILIILMTLLGSIASLFLKRSTGGGSILSIIKNYNFYLGGILYFLSALINIIVLKNMEYSIVLPLTSITYIWTMFISYLVLKENISLKKIAGIVLIVVGAIVISI